MAAGLIAVNLRRFLGSLLAVGISVLMVSLATCSQNKDQIKNGSGKSEQEKDYDVYHEEQKKRDGTKKELRRLALAFQVHRHRHGVYPTRPYWKPLLEGEVLKGSAYVLVERSKSGIRVVDYWGSPIQVTEHAGGLIIRSFGRNRVNENGQGDDISVKLSP